MTTEARDGDIRGHQEHPTRPGPDDVATRLADAEGRVIGVSTEARDALAAALHFQWHNRLPVCSSSSHWMNWRTEAADILAALDGWTLVPTSTVAALRKAASDLVRAYDEFEEFSLRDRVEAIRAALTGKE